MVHAEVGKRRGLSGFVTRKGNIFNGTDHNEPLFHNMVKLRIRHLANLQCASWSENLLHKTSLQRGAEARLM